MSQTDQARDILTRVATASRLREGPEGVLSILRAVHRHGNAPLKEIARDARLPLPVAGAVRRELEKAGLLNRDGGMTLSPRGRQFATEKLDLTANLVAVCRACQGRGIEPPAEETLEAMRRLLDSAPPVDFALDQAPCTPETSLRRAALMFEAGALEGRRLLVLGDDDSVSLAVCLLYRRAVGRDPAHPITVIELDPNRVNFIEETAGRERFPIRVIRHDLRDPLPDALSKQFDSFETDPPYTLEGATLFLRRARQALVDRSGATGFFSFGHRPPVEQHQLLDVIAAEGYAVTTMRAHFNSYAGAAVLGNTGQMIELATIGPHPIDHERWSDHLYTAEVNPRRRQYRCADCGTSYELGQDGIPEMIEALKVAGCPKCGGHTFRRQHGSKPLPPVAQGN